MHLSDEFVSTFLNRAGFSGMISIADVELMLRGLRFRVENCTMLSTTLLLFLISLVLKKQWAIIKYTGPQPIRH